MLPFPGGLQQNENGMMIFAIIAAGLYLLRPANTSGGKWAVIKTIPVALFALVAWQQYAPFMLIAALILSAVGDHLLAYEGEGYFLGGLGAFFLAHVAYIILFIASSSGWLWHVPWRLALVLLLLIHAAVMTRRLSVAVPSDMRIPVFAYIGAISVMGLTATLSISPLILFGVFLFIVSDTLLAIGRFLIMRDDERQSVVQPGVWITYVAAQMCILLGFAAAIQMP